MRTPYLGRNISRVEHDLQSISESLSRVELALDRQNARLDEGGEVSSYLCTEAEAQDAQIDRIENRLESHHERLRIIDAKLDRLIALANRSVDGA